MKKIFLITMLLSSMFIFGCENNDEVVLVTEDVPPQPPQGVFSITGDQQITIIWSGLWEEDVVEYIIGWNDSLLGDYEEVGRVSANPRTSDNRYGFIDTDVVNNQTYFYAVWAVDAIGHVSLPSFEAVFDTPRPEGNVDLFTLKDVPNLSGYDFSGFARVPFNDVNSDIFIDSDWYIVGNDTLRIFSILAADLATDIQDMGYTETFDDIDWAPAFGWSDLREYELIPEHTYVIWTWDSHYAKVRVNAIDTAAGLVNLDWAYQLADTTNVLGNRELIGPPPDAETGTTTIMIDDSRL